METRTIHAPGLSGGPWFNSPPLRMKDLRGKVVLVDFWDYSCVNCLRTLPYLAEWHSRYTAHGLVIIGVHAPEFEFAHNPEHVRKAVESLGIRHPVMMDSEKETWKAFANRYWPAKYLVDAAGFIRYSQVGEGAYGETEEAIQALLREAGALSDFPAPVVAVRPTDEPGAVCHPVTPELYMGQARGRIGNPEGVDLKQVVNYVLPEERAPDVAYLEGHWKAERDYLEFVGPGEGRVVVRCTAAEVNVVLHSNRLGGAMEVRRDGHPVALEDGGEDVEEHSGRTWIRIDQPRMYRMIKNAVFGSHEVELIARVPGVAVYAWTFVSCVAV